MPVITVRIKYHLFFPILLRAAGAARQWACIDVMTSALQCTGTTFVLIVLIRRRRTFAIWIILIGCAKTDEPITGNITGSFCICLLANTAWPSYVVLHDRLAINNETRNVAMIFKVYSRLSRAILIDRVCDITCFSWCVVMCLCVCLAPFTRCCRLLVN